MARSRLGPLALETPLGKSARPGESSVWRAIHVQHRRMLAVRIFQVPFGGTVESRQQFADEWESLKRLNHPAIVKCFGGGFEESRAYLVHELIEGPTLESELERRGRLPWETVLELAEPLTEALKYLHDRGLVHGRIGPSKIVVAGFSPVLLDVRQQDGTAPFRSGPFYVSRPPTMESLMRRPPESPGPHDAIGVRGDLYLLGATLYEALTGSPPITGSSLQEVQGNLKFQSPTSVASTVLDCPVWMDRLVMQLLQKDPRKRPVSAAAVGLQLAEVRRRAMSRAGVAEHASSGFSPLSVTDEDDRAEARTLLGRAAIELKDERAEPDGSAWYDQVWFLAPVLGLLLAGLLWLAWPLSEDAMRQRAEDLLAQERRSALSQARISYLEPMLRRFPEGEHAEWASEQIDRVEMIEAEHALTVKINRNLPLQNEAERLCAEAMQYETFGDAATAVDKYQSMVTLLGGDPEYRPLVNLARNRIARIQAKETEQSEASIILADRLEEADRLYRQGRTVSARQIWYSIVELYGSNAAVGPQVQTAQERLAETSGTIGNSAQPGAD